MKGASTTIGTDASRSRWLPPHLIGMTEEELKDHLKDAHWRLRNLYFIVDKEKQVVLFEPNQVQNRFIERIWFKNVIIKARQRGFSTLIQVMALDWAVFNENFIASVIAQDRETSEAMFNQKIKFAHDRLPEMVRQMNPLITDSKTSLEFQSGSVAHVSTSARGGTLNLLHISEFGIISARSPDKAQEIQEGSLPAADKGLIFVESTLDSPEGPFADMVKRAVAREQQGDELARQDYRLHWASWYDADEYQEDPRLVVVSPEDNAYFHRMEGIIGQPIEAPRRAWWVAKRNNDFNGDDGKMWAQYPTTIEEAFTVSSESKWLSQQMARARTAGRITDVPYHPLFPVHTYWDVGDTVCVSFAQHVGATTRWIDFKRWVGVPYSEIVRQLNLLPYNFGPAWLPWDAHSIPKEGVLKVETTMMMLESLLPNWQFEWGPQADNVEAAIQLLRDIFNTYWIDKTKCADLIVACDNYSKTYSRARRRWMEVPLKDGNDHPVDSIRVHAQVHNEILLGLHTPETDRKSRQSRGRRPPRGGMGV